MTDDNDAMNFAATGTKKATTNKQICCDNSTAHIVCDNDVMIFIATVLFKKIHT